MMDRDNVTGSGSAREDRRALVENYLSYAQDLCRDQSNSPNSRDYWAVDALDAVIEEAPDDAWDILQTLVRVAPDDRVLAFIAAGPLENLLAAHGHTLIEHVEDAARLNPKLRRALSGVWGENRMPEAVTARLRFITRDEPPF